MARYAFQRFGDPLKVLVPNRAYLKNDRAITVEWPGAWIESFWCRAVDDLDLFRVAVKVAQQVALCKLGDDGDLGATLFWKPVPEEPEEPMFQAVGVLKRDAVGYCEDSSLLMQQVG
jgi:hypothetical protein